MPMLFSPTIGAAIAAGYWFLWVRCPACRTANAIDLRTLDPSPRRGRDKSHSRAVMPLVPAECTIRRARASIPNEHRRRNARGV
jgi:phage FluMu protein Com